jgi:hypothetical protein
MGENAVVRCGRGGADSDLIRYIWRIKIKLKEKMAIQPRKAAAGAQMRRWVGWVRGENVQSPSHAVPLPETQRLIHHSAAGLLDLFAVITLRNWFHQLEGSTSICEALIQYLRDLCQVIALIRQTLPGFGVVDLAATFRPTVH